MTHARRALRFTITGLDVTPEALAWLAKEGYGETWRPASETADPEINSGRAVPADRGGEGAGEGEGESAVEKGRIMVRKGG